jgi:CheY-like chemotaxis protein
MNHNKLEKPPLVLIAEDDDSAYLLISTLLKKALLRSIRARNGVEAVELVRKNHEIQLVLMDMRMPEMDGLEATRLIKFHRSDLPIIALTAYEFDEKKQAIMEAGCDDFISKPICRNDLKARLQKYGL